MPCCGLTLGGALHLDGPNPVEYLLCLHEILAMYVMNVLSPGIKKVSVAGADVESRLKQHVFRVALNRIWGGGDCATNQPKPVEVFRGCWRRIGVIYCALPLF